MAINLEQTYNQQAILDILADGDIWNRFSDGVDFNDFYPEINDTNGWLIVRDDDREIGIIYLKCSTSCAIEFHPYLYKSDRKLGREMVKAFFKWFLDNTDLVKINAIIPDKLKQVINFALKVGFKKEGIDRMSYNRGKCDRVMLGITRSEVKSWLV